jgi:archaellum component FlaC
LENVQSKQDKNPAGDSDSNQEAEIQGLREELEEMTEAKDHFETQYKNLLGRVNTIKTSLGDRLKADTVYTPLVWDQLVQGWLY